MYCKLFVISLVVLCTGTAYAESLSEGYGVRDSRSNLRFGYMPMVSHNRLSDPDGPTATNTHATPLSAVVVYNNIQRDARLFGQAYYDFYDLKGSPQNIAQKVREAGVNASYQWMFRVARNWRPYVGIGLGFGKETSTERYNTTPSGGHINTSFPNRTVQSFKALVTTSSEWSVADNWDLGIHLQFEQPLSDGSTAIRAGVYLTY